MPRNCYSILRTLCALLYLLPMAALPAQLSDTLALQVQRTAQPVKIDGIHDEPVWQTPQSARHFWEKWPQDNRQAIAQTEVRVAADDQYLYIAAICYGGGPFTIQTLKRDSRYWDSDGFAVVIDPVFQRTNGFFFGVSPLNVQAEDLLGSDSEEMSFSWDNRWFSATRILEDRWTLEMAIPFKTLRYTAGKSTWGINFIRNDAGNNQYSAWTPIPVQLDGTDLGYTGQLHWDIAPQPTGVNASLIPYGIASAAANPDDEPRQSSSFNVGADAKVTVGTALNIEVTINPDFSQVEVDEQVTNLTRFNIFFPERRTFFLENADLFSSYGFPGLRPFFSRTIGLDANARPIPIVAGVRITGNAGKKLRVGAMNMQTRATDDFDAQNYTAASVNYRVLKRSLIKVYGANRQNTSPGRENNRDYNRNYGTELIYQSPSSNVMAWSAAHLSDRYGYRNRNGFYQFGGFYNGRRIFFITDFVLVGENYFTDMGFNARIENYDALRDTVIRLGFNQNYTEIEYYIRPENGPINNHRFGLETFLVWNPDGSLNERFNRLRYFIDFNNTSSLQLRFEHQDIRLMFPFAFTDGQPLPAGAYAFAQFNAEYQSDIRRTLVYSAGIRLGGFYNGKLRQYQAELAYRRQPWGNFSLRAELNQLSFPKPYGQENLLLVGPRIEVNFSNSLFWTTFLQFNTQRQNFNINSRLQWRFRPMSDVFLVYTDNYTAEFPLINKNRAVVLKVNYWWTL